MLTLGVLILFLSVTSSAGHQTNTVCDEVTCGLNEKCYVWPSDPEQPVCIAYIKEGDYERVLDIDGIQYLETYKCPEFTEEKKRGSRDCGPVVMDECEDDAACNSVDDGCCFDGCKNSCLKMETSIAPVVADVRK